MRSFRFVVAVGATSMLAFAACGGDDSGGGEGGGGSAAGGGGQRITGVKVIDPASMDGARGNVTYCAGRDATGSTKAAARVQPRRTGRRACAPSCSSSRSRPTSSATSP